MPGLVRNTHAHGLHTELKLRSMRSPGHFRTHPPRSAQVHRASEIRNSQIWWRREEGKPPSWQRAWLRQLDREQQVGSQGLTMQLRKPLTRSQAKSDTRTPRLQRALRHKRAIRDQDCYFECS